METCPHCESTQIAGYEVRGAYDGVLYWVCQDCNLAIPRHFDEKAYALASKNWAREHNEKRATPR